MRRHHPELVLTAALVLLAIPATYSIARLAQAALYPEPDPVLVLSSTRVAMFWRLGISAYVAAFVAPIAFLWARRHPGSLARALPGAVLAVSVIVGAQGLLVP